MARETVRFVSIDDHPSISDALRQASAGYDDLEMIGSFTSVSSVPNPLRAPGRAHAVDEPRATLTAFADDE